MKHGVSHGFSMTHRKIRVSEMIEEIIKDGKKAKVQDFKDITFDVLDVQMRASHADMIGIVERNLDSKKLSAYMKTKAQLGLDVASNWDYKYDKSKP